MAKGGAKEAMLYYLGTRRVLTDGAQRSSSWMLSLVYLGEWKNSPRGKERSGSPASAPVRNWESMRNNAKVWSAGGCILKSQSRGLERSTGLHPTDEPGQTVTEKLSLGITTQITTKLKSDFQLTEVYKQTLFSQRPSYIL